MIRRALALIAGVWLGGAAQAQTVQVEGGTLEGVTQPSGVRAWLGVPFAAPPVRELRWKPPAPVQPWAGTYHADRYAPMCLQAGRGRAMNHYFGHEATSEDCLYLNIWAPAEMAPAAKAKPVVVWIYGGAFTVGSASMANYSGEPLAEKGVVRVNLAYRVGHLGFLSHAELSKEGGGSSGNYGLMDQIAALAWIKRNIASFGGDPANVTIVGQSAGSMSVALLQASPLAKGLFHRAVGMSGSPYAEPMRVSPLAEGETAGLRLQQALGAPSIVAMRDLAGDRITNVPMAPEAALVQDGRVLPGPPDPATNAVPLMLGFTRDEAFRSLGPVKDKAGYEAALRKIWPQTAAAILKDYPVASDADVARAVADVQRDASLGLQMASWARRNPAPVYAWFFTRRQPYAPGISFSDHDPATAGAYHSGDIPYWLRTMAAFNLFRTTRQWEPIDQALSDSMSQALISFAQGKPPAPDWPVFDARRPKVKELGEVIRVRDWPHYRALDLFRGGASIAPPPASARRVRD